MDDTGEKNPPDTNTQKPDFEQWAGIAKPPPPTEKHVAPPEKTGSEAQSKILPFPPVEEQEEEDPETSTNAYGRYRLPGGGYTVEIFLSSGEVDVIPYNQIIKISSNLDATRLSIQTAHSGLYVIAGQNLSAIRSALGRHRVCFIKCPAQGPDKVMIQSITLEPKDPDK